MASTKSLDGVIKRLWAFKEAGMQNHFDLLFNKNVPHILEKIFLNLEDYDSFMACQDVCKAWRGLFSSELFKKRARDLLYEKMGWKKDFTEQFGAVWRNGALCQALHECCCLRRFGFLMRM